MGHEVRRLRCRRLRSWAGHAFIKRGTDATAHDATYAPASGSLAYTAANTANLHKWFAGARELTSVAFLNYGINGQTRAGWAADTTGRYGITGTVAQKADLFVFPFGINDVRTGAMSEDILVTNMSAIDAPRANETSTVLLRRRDALCPTPRHSSTG
ncbi:hypothetical protein J2T10_000252 [Paenarthrobacter nicotinovorans]|uniref:SGNH hydrolase-type esterase domain-containing protein n=1 Tax=Paenarthrobacter nicotinovorans TaxID=29320 RepID=A0ABT9TI65_PAENI|nr:hypothetical protein [Paenarthrobacter nicotinovorans]MDQ0100633.1 hypothetical protein [Paenarthrobacter nicotinovorans]